MQRVDVVARALMFFVVMCAVIGANENGFLMILYLLLMKRKPKRFLKPLANIQNNNPLEVER